jgi:hypothetical protein
MSRQGIANRKPLYPATLAALAALCLAAAGGAGAQSGSSCSTAIDLSANTTHRSAAASEEGSKFFELELTATGVLTLDALTPGDPADGVTLNFRGKNCASPGGEGTDFRYVRQAPSWLVLEILSTGTYSIEVAPEDPVKELVAFNLRNALAANLAEPLEETDPAQDPTASCGSGATPISEAAFDEDDWVGFTDDFDEWDDDVISGFIEVPGIVVVSRGSGAAMEAALYEGLSCPESARIGQAVLQASGGRLGAVTFAGDHLLTLSPHSGSTGSYTLDFRFFDPCSRGEVDDHGDGFGCSTSVAPGGSKTGQLDNAYGDDADAFTFVLTAQETVEMETSGSTDTYGILYDKDGQRLDADDDGGADANFRIVETLAAGRYFVRVEGKAGAEGSYTLAVDLIE